jgi:PleD family two-component response regulator
MVAPFIGDPLSECNTKSSPAILSRKYVLRKLFIMKFEILIVDDDKAHLSMLTILKGWGYQTTEVEDGSEAILNVREKSFDCILMDVRMANVSGIDPSLQLVV